MSAVTKRSSLKGVSKFTPEISLKGLALGVIFDTEAKSIPLGNITNGPVL